MHEHSDSIGDTSIERSGKFVGMMQSRGGVSRRNVPGTGELFGNPLDGTGWAERYEFISHRLGCDIEMYFLSAAKKNPRCSLSLSQQIIDMNTCKTDGITKNHSRGTERAKRTPILRLLARRSDRQSWTSNCTVWPELLPILRFRGMHLA